MVRCASCGSQINAQNGAEALRSMIRGKLRQIFACEAASLADKFKTTSVAQWRQIGQGLSDPQEGTTAKALNALIGTTDLDQQKSIIHLLLGFLERKLHGEDYDSAAAAAIKTLAEQLKKTRNYVLSDGKASGKSGNFYEQGTVIEDAAKVIEFTEGDLKGLKLRLVMQNTKNNDAVDSSNLHADILAVTNNLEPFCSLKNLQIGRINFDDLPYTTEFIANLIFKRTNEVEY